MVAAEEDQRRLLKASHQLRSDIVHGCLGSAKRRKDIHLARALFVIFSAACSTGTELSLQFRHQAFRSKAGRFKAGRRRWSWESTIVLSDRQDIAGVLNKLDRSVYGEQRLNRFS